MTNDGIECKLSLSVFTGLAERPKIRWQDDIKEDLRIMGVNNWENASRIGLNGKT
jgi:hypothetical protein